jgi:hypothetical protein
MKKILILMLLILLTTVLYGQNVSTLNVRYGALVDNIDEMSPEKFATISMSPDGIPAEYVSLFKFSNNTIKHVTDDVKSTYFIEDKIITEGVTIYFVVSDTGYNYIIVLNVDKRLFTFIYDGGEGNLRITEFELKNAW